MRMRIGWVLRLWAVVLVLAAFGVAGSGCASKGAKKPDKITQELLTLPKEELFEKGKALIAKKKYEDFEPDERQRSEAILFRLEPRR